jgi:hypothetical protein
LLDAGAREVRALTAARVPTPLAVEGRQQQGAERRQLTAES